MSVKDKSNASFEKLKSRLPYKQALFASHRLLLLHLMRTEKEETPPLELPFSRHVLRSWGLHFMLLTGRASTEQALNTSKQAK